MTTTAAAIPFQRLRAHSTDEELAALVATGDSRAFEELYERYREPLLGCLRSMLREPEDARDALQITMLNAFRALREAKVPNAVRPWLFTIARNAAVSTTRRRVIELEIADDDAPIDHGPAEAVVERERVERLLDDLEAMAPRRRQIVLMRAVQGLGYDEIGGELGISPAAARQAAREARVALDETARGRDLRCEDVSTVLELGDTRNARSRSFLAHLRACASCRGRLPARSITRSQVAAILAGLLAIRTAVAKALTLPASAIETIGNASLAAKAASIAAVAVTTGSGIVAGLHGDSRRATPDRAAAAPRTAPVVPALAEPRPTSEAAATPPVQPQATEHETEAKPSDRPPDAAPATPSDGPASPPAEPAVEAAPSATDNGEGTSEGEPLSAGSQAAPPDPAPERDEQQASDSRGASGLAPGHGGEPPGQGGTPPGQAGGSSGASGSAPGHGGTPPGQGGTPPGQAVEPSGPSATSQGQSGSPPGQGGTPPGQADFPSEGTPAAPGQSPAGEAPGASASAPGHTDAAGESHGGGNGK